MTATAFFSALLQSIADEGGLVVLVLVILFLGARRVWLWRWSLDRLESQLTEERVEFMGRMNEMRSERDQWRNLALWQSGRKTVDDPPPPPPSEGD
jgi:hypothetical protein